MDQQTLDSLVVLNFLARQWKRSCTYCASAVEIAEACGLEEDRARQIMDCLKKLGIREGDYAYGAHHCRRPGHRGQG